MPYQLLDNCYVYKIKKPGKLINPKKYKIYKEFYKYFGDSKPIKRRCVYFDAYLREQPLMVWMMVWQNHEGADYSRAP